MFGVVDDVEGGATAISSIGLPMMVAMFLELKLFILLLAWVSNLHAYLRDCEDDGSEVKLELELDGEPGVLPEAEE